MQNLGWREDHNIRIDVRWLGSNPQRIQAETTDLIARKPEVIVSGTSVAIAQTLQTSAIPIVFAGITDPVSQSFVKSLARPDSNATGFAAYEASLGGKWIETLKELWSGLGRAAVLYEPTTAPYMPDILGSIVAAGPSFGVQIEDAQTAHLLCWGDSQTLALSFRRRHSLTPIPTSWSRWRPNTAHRRSMRSGLTSRPAA
jgi:putative ABC transport system substrate-binding protein